MAAHNNGNLYADLVPADERVEAVSGTQELAGGCLDGRVVNLRSQVLEQLNTNLLFNSSMAGATGSVLPTNWASGSVSGLTYTISSASTVQGLRSIQWTVSGTALSDGDLWLACEPMVSGSVVAQIPSEYVGSMYCAKVSGTINAGMVLQTLTQNFINGAVQETKTKDLAAVTGQTFVRIEPNSVKTDVDLENRVNLRLYQSIASGEVIDFTIRVAAPQVEAGVTASPFISTVSGAVSEVRGRPSILVVPQLTKAGTVYPQLPTVSGADFTFTRATNATRVNSSGLIESVASGVPRIDWLGQSCPALLVEASAQNLALQSEAFDNASWSKTDITVTTGSTSAFTAPDGTTNADLFTSTASGSSFLAQTITIASGAATFSVFAKAGNHGIFRIGNVSSAARAAWFDLNAGAVIGTVNGGTASIQNYGSGWYRCIFTASSVVSGGSTFIIAISDAANGTASVSGATMYAWGAQLETGSIATTYIPTTTAAVSRAADVISASGALVSGLIGQTEGTIYAEVDVRNLGFGRSFMNVQDSSFASNAIRIECDGNQWRIQIRAATINVLDETITSPTFTTGTYKIAMAYNNAASGVVFAVNGTIIYTSASALTMPSGMDRVHLGTRLISGIFSFFLNDRIRAAALYTTRLSNAQLAELTRL